MKKSVLITFCVVFLLYGCAEKQKVITGGQLLQVVSHVKAEPSNPKDFELKIPESSMIRNSLVSFNKTYQRVYSDSNVTSMAAGKEMITVLKPDEIGFTITSCPGLYLKNTYDNVRVYGLEAAIYNSSYIDVYSASECASLGTYPRMLNGSVEIVPNYIIEWAGSQAALRNSYNGDELYTGDTGLLIKAAGYVNGAPVLLQENGYILTYDKSMQAFILTGQIPSGYNEIYHSEGRFYGTLKDEKKFFVLDNDTVKISDNTDCTASPYSVSGLCGTTLITDNEIYHDLPVKDKFASTSTTFITLDKSNINIYYLETVWQRFLSMSYERPKACVSGKSVYYKSFSGSIYQNINGKESKISVMPKKCSSKNVVLNYGEFYCSGKKCGKFAIPIKNNKDAVMYRRVEDNTIYYYFDNLDFLPFKSGSK